ncbi:MAG: rhomboid family intramembrane serine protease [Bacteroidales bacterium]|nr:rhomboid family intramembrane serine protease [Bacteroidales bacterium]
MQGQRVGSQLSGFFRSKSLLSVIIIINVVVWIVTLFFPIVDYLYARPVSSLSGRFVELFALSSQVEALVSHPWTPLTYMFLHDGFWHLLFNMLMLYFGGVMFYRYLGSRRFGWVYFLSGLTGAMLYLLVYNAFPVGATVSYLVGASAAVLGVFIAVAVYMPNYEVQFMFLRAFSFKFKYIALAYVIVDLLSIPVDNAGGHIAHIGGALFGALYVVGMRQWAKNKLRPSHKKIKVKQKRKPAASDRPLTDDEYNRRRAADQKKVDAILDKISKSGYDNLSKEEKEFLFKYKV